jgi:hypothetical protein
MDGEHIGGLLLDATQDALVEVRVVRADLEQDVTVVGMVDILVAERSPRDRLKLLGGC